MEKSKKSTFLDLGPPNCSIFHPLSESELGFDQIPSKMGQKTRFLIEIGGVPWGPWGEIGSDLKNRPLAARPKKLPIPDRRPQILYTTTVPGVPRGPRGPPGSQGPLGTPRDPEFLEKTKKNKCF